MAKIGLDFPIEADGVEVAELSMRRPKVKDVTAIGKIKDREQAEKQLFANLCEIPPDAIENMDLADYQKLQDVYESFLSPRSENADA